MAPSGQETQTTPFAPESAGSEEDILKEFNNIIKPGAGVVSAGDVEAKRENGEAPKKEKKKLRQKIVFEPYDPEKHGAMAAFPGVQGYEEVERYWVDEPYAFTVILYNESTNNYLYYVVEPSLTVFEKELLVEVYDRLQDVLMIENLDVTTDKKELLKEKTIQIINDYIGKIDTKSYYKIMYYIDRDYLEFGKINPIMHDNFIEDISNNGFDTPIFLYHKNYENIMTNVIFGEKQLNSYVIRLAQKCGKHISIAEPMVDATMPDGSRIQMTLGKEITTRGSTFTIRKFKEVPITPIDLIAWNTFSSEMMAYLWLCIENNKSLIFSGGTASGKTSSLNAVSLFIPPKAKVVSLGYQRIKITPYELDPRPDQGLVHCGRQGRHRDVLAPQSGTEAKARIPARRRSPWQGSPDVIPGHVHRPHDVLHHARGLGRIGHPPSGEPAHQRAPYHDNRSGYHQHPGSDVPEK
jgi:flagellar protein FlaI